MRSSHAMSSELDKIDDLLAAEFFDDPILKFAFPNTTGKRRRETMRRFFRIYVDLAIEYGGVLIAENNSGVLVYFRPEIMKMADEKSVLLDSQLRQECGSDYATVVAFMNGLSHHHPQTPPHYYIFLIAVQRQYRRKGVAKSLLGELNIILDSGGVSCYAECTTLSSRSLFRFSGYHDTSPPLHIEGFPELFPVWRNPQ